MRFDRWAAVLALAFPLLAQAPLRTTVRLVIAPTTVVDPQGRYVNGLTESDFRVTDNGQRRRDVHVDYGYIPMSLVVAVECSFPSAAVVNKVHKIGSMIQPLVMGERGQAAVVSFDGQVTVRQDFTNDIDKLDMALQAIQPGDYGARMIDAVAESVRLLAAQPPERRRVLLLISETRDRGSRTKLAAAVTLAQQDNVAIYTLAYSPYTTAFTAKAGTTPPPDHLNTDPFVFLFEMAHMAKKNAAEAFARYTGGERLSFTRQKALEQAVARIGEELHSQYLVSFAAPPDAGAGFHAITVSVPGVPGSKVRTRAGYWMAEPQP